MKKTLPAFNLVDVISSAIMSSSSHADCALIRLDLPAPGHKIRQICVQGNTKDITVLVLPVDALYRVVDRLLPVQIFWVRHLRTILRGEACLFLLESCPVSIHMFLGRRDHPFVFGCKHVFEASLRFEKPH